MVVEERVVEEANKQPKRVEVTRMKFDSLSGVLGSSSGARALAWSGPRPLQERLRCSPMDVGANQSAAAASSNVPRVG